MNLCILTKMIFKLKMHQKWENMYHLHPQLSLSKFVCIWRLHKCQHVSPKHVYNIDNNKPWSLDSNAKKSVLMTDELFLELFDIWTDHQNVTNIVLIYWRSSKVLDFNGDKIYDSTSIMCCSRHLQERKRMIKRWVM